MQAITISELKAHLSAEIKKLKKTGGLEIRQRDVLVARLLPVEDKRTVKYHSVAKGKFQFLPPVVETTADPVEILLEDRRKERL